LGRPGSDRLLYDELAFRTERLAEFVPRGALTADGTRSLALRQATEAAGGYSDLLPPAILAEAWEYQKETHAWTSRS
jgi:hypothetical protein